MEKMEEGRMVEGGEGRGEEDSCIYRDHGVTGSSLGESRTLSSVGKGSRGDKRTSGQVN